MPAVVAAIRPSISLFTYMGRSASWNGLRQSFASYHRALGLHKEILGQEKHVVHMLVARSYRALYGVDAHSQEFEYLFRDEVQLSQFLGRLYGFSMQDEDHGITSRYLTQG